MASFPPPVSLLAFEAVARRHSIGLAAVELRLTPATIRQQIAELESFLRVPLLESSSRAVSLSRAGACFLPQVAGVLKSLRLASADLGQELRSTLNVRSAPGIASLWLMPRLRAFVRCHPEITLNLSSSDWYSDFALDQSDIDIRCGTPSWRDLVIEPLFDECMVPIASTSFIDRYELKRPDQLLKVPMIQSGLLGWPAWFQTVGVEAPIRTAMHFDHSELALDAAARGLGVVLESTTIASRHLANGMVRTVFGPAYAIRIKQHFAVYPHRHGERAPVKAFLTWLRAEASRTQ